MTDYDPAIQSKAILESLDRLRTINEQFAWGNDKEYASLHMSYVSITDTATAMANLPPEIARDMRASAYELIDAMDEMADSITMVMERIPALRRQPQTGVKEN